MTRRNIQQHRLDRDNAPSVRAYKRPPRDGDAVQETNAVLDCGWGRLIFGHTFDSNAGLVETLRAERDSRRDIAMYIGEPHIVLSLAPQELFLDPSHTYRLYLDQYRSVNAGSPAFVVRKLHSLKDAEGVNNIYARRHMVTVDPAFMWGERASRRLVYLVAEDEASGQIIGTVTGVDHYGVFGDRERGSSLWALAVDPQTTHPGVGHALAVHLIEHFVARGRSFIDLSVLYDNAQAIRLYEKLGFSRVPVFCIKRKNSFNEPLFIAQQPDAALNPYAAIIVREARRRGIAVHVLDAEHAYFELSFGGRTIVCRESLSELTTAIAMSRCDDKRVTHRLLSEAGLSMPAQQTAGTVTENKSFLERHRHVVVKPARGEQGRGVSVDLTTEVELEGAIGRAQESCDDVILEQLVDGYDLRVIVIDYRVVAAAVRRPPEVTGTGTHSIAELIDKQSRRRAAATGGESRIPVDAETARCVGSAGYELDSVLESGKTLPVRKTANLHTGGTIHDVTDELHPALIEVCKRAAEVLDIPVVGLDLIVPSVRQAAYSIIEANERPGLANHEPQPTAERFVDLLFPQTIS